MTFKDEEIGLTQTCDKVIEDYAAPKYKEKAKKDTVYLLHCTLDFTGDVGFSHQDHRLHLAPGTKRNPSARLMSTGAVGRRPEG